MGSSGGSPEVLDVVLGWRYETVFYLLCEYLSLGAMDAPHFTYLQGIVVRMLNAFNPSSAQVRRPFGASCEPKPTSDTCK